MGVLSTPENELKTPKEPYLVLLFSPAPPIQDPLLYSPVSTRGAISQAPLNPGVFDSLSQRGCEWESKYLHFEGKDLGKPVPPGNR